MKYLRKIVALLIAVVLAASIAVGLGVIFAVKNVNVTLVSYSYEEDSDEAKQLISEFKGKISDKVRGTLMGYVGEDDVATVLEGSKFAVSDCEKVYPCTLNVTVKERRETFAVQSNEVFEVYDDHGVFVRSAPTREQSFNGADGAPNVFIEGASTAAQIKEVADISAIFEKHFSSLRTITEKVIFTPETSQIQKGRITFALRCGISIEIRDFKVLAAEKIAAAFNKFISLSGEEKLGGTIYSHSTSGEVIATYNANS